MYTFEHSPGCISFTFFGVPTIIRPSSWLVLLILGSGAGNTGLDLASTLIFVAAGMLCLLVHEYGHAFSCRALGGGRSVVEIASMGGVTISNYPPRTRLGHLLMVLAGPGASILMGALGGVILGLHLDIPLFQSVVYAMTWPLPFDMPKSVMDWAYIPVLAALNDGWTSPFTKDCYQTLFFVCVWWSLFNLLPIYPMDGGKALYLATDNQRLTGAIGVIISVLLGVWSLLSGMLFTAFLCAWFVWINWQYMRLVR